MSGWTLAWSIGRRELDWRFRGLRLLFFCLVLGVASLVAVGSLADAIDRALTERGSVILGGDLEVSRSARLATPQERAALEATGRLAESVRMTSAAVAGAQSIPIQLKAVDAAYPLYGAMTLSDGRKVGLPPSRSAWVDPALAARIPVGSSFRLGTQIFRVAGVIAEEPDRLGEGFSLGPVVIISMPDAIGSGLTQPGSLFEARYRIATSQNPQALADRIKRVDPSAGWEMKTRDRAAPGTDRFFTRMGEFLTLILLTSLVISSVGIANAVTSFLRARQGNIATLKVLGAQSSQIQLIYGLQIGLVSGLAIITGLIIGTAAVPMIAQATRDVIPVPIEAAISWKTVALSSGFAILTVIAASVIPLARAAFVPVAGLLRGAVDVRQAPLSHAISWVIGAALLMLILALSTASRPWLTAGFLASVMGVLGALGALGWLIRWGAATLSKPRNPFLRLALGSLHRPGAGTIGLVVALGVGLIMFVQIAAVRSSFDANLARTIPDRAPSFFVLDVPRDRESEFRRVVAAVDPKIVAATVPLLRGTITGYGTTNVADLKAIPDGAWALRGERGLTYSRDLPVGSTITDGTWWPSAYSGPPLVSVDERLQKALDLKLGDEIRVSVFGVERAAKIASFRRIDWDSLGFNFVLVFSPNTLTDIPHNLSATLASHNNQDTKLRDIITTRFPSVSVIPVRDVIEQVGEVAKGVAIAIAWAASSAILAGIAVLAGTTAAMRDVRTYDGVILRVLGATGRQLLWLQLLEFIMLGAIVAVVALILGLISAWLIVTQLFNFAWLPDHWMIAITLIAGLVIVLLVGMAGSVSTLRARPSRALRSL